MKTVNRISVPLDSMRHVNRPQSTYFVSTKGPNSCINVAPINIALKVSNNPLRFLLGVRRTNDTSANVLSNRNFTASLATASLANQAIVTARKLPPHVSELDYLKYLGISLTAYSPAEINGLPPGIRETPLTHWCNIRDGAERHLTEGKETRTVVIGEAIHTEISSCKLDDLAQIALYYRGTGRFTTCHPIDGKHSTDQIFPPQLKYMIVVKSADTGQFIYEIPMFICEITHHPPRFFIGCREDSALFRAVKKNKEFTVNMITQPLIDDSTITRDLTLQNFDHFSPHGIKSLMPAISQSQLNFWCMLEDDWLDKSFMLEENDGDSLILFPARVNHIFVDPFCVEAMQMGNETPIQRLCNATTPVLGCDDKVLYVPRTDDIASVAQEAYPTWFKQMSAFSDDGLLNELERDQYMAEIREDFNTIDHEILREVAGNGKITERVQELIIRRLSLAQTALKLKVENSLSCEVEIIKPERICEMMRRIEKTATEFGIDITQAKNLIKELIRANIIEQRKLLKERYPYKSEKIPCLDPLHRDKIEIFFCDQP